MERRIRTLLATVAVIGLLSTCACAFAFGVYPAISVFVGAAIAWANLYGLARIVQLIAPADDAKPRKGAGGWVVFALLKVVLAVGLVWVLWKLGLVQPLPLLAGFASLPIGIAIGAFIGDRTGSEAA